jgi:RNA polymerase-binding transcription factor DksA
VEERYESELAQSTRVLNDVDRALARLSDGTYGSCETCGEPILDLDLAVDPTRRVCGLHLEAAEWTAGAAAPLAPIRPAD